MNIAKTKLMNGAGFVLRVIEIFSVGVGNYCERSHELHKHYGKYDESRQTFFHGSILLRNKNIVIIGIIVLPLSFSDNPPLIGPFQIRPSVNKRRPQLDEFRNWLMTTESRYIGTFFKDIELVSA